MNCLRVIEPGSTNPIFSSFSCFVRWRSALCRSLCPNDFQRRLPPQTVTQYSLHECSAPGEIEHHYEYLVGSEKDCRRELVKLLIKDCGKKGSSLIYSTFEKTVINNLIEEYPDLKDDLEKLIDRMVDLCAL